MNTYTDKTQENKSQSMANAVSQKQSSGKATLQFVDNRPEAIAQRKLQSIINSNAHISQPKVIQRVKTEYTAAAGTVTIVDPSVDAKLARELLIFDKLMGRIKIQSNETLAAFVTIYVHSKGYDVDKRNKAYTANKRQHLGELLSQGAIACRELSLLAHTLLAKKGIGSRVKAGSNKEDTMRHGWLMLSQRQMLDPTSNVIVDAIQPAAQYLGVYRNHEEDHDLAGVPQVRLDTKIMQTSLDQIKRQWPEIQQHILAATAEVDRASGTSTQAQPSAATSTKVDDIYDFR